MLEQWGKNKQATESGESFIACAELIENPSGRQFVDRVLTQLKILLGLVDFVAGIALRDSAFEL